MKGSIALIAATVLLTPVSAADTGRPVNDFMLPSATDGALIRLSDYAGKVVLINWWRTSCPFSQKETPRLVGLYQKYRDKGLVIIGISAESDDGVDTVVPIPEYVKRNGITWPIVLNDQAEFRREIFDPLAHKDSHTPANYLVSRSGQIVYLGLDRTPEKWPQLEDAVARAIAEPTSAAVSIRPAGLRAAPALDLSDLDGKPFTLARFAGKPLVVNFFNAQSCDFAGAVLAKLQHDYAARGLQVIGVDLFDEPAQARTCLTKYGATYPVLRGTGPAQVAWIGRTWSWATVFVTADGKVFKNIDESVPWGHERQVFPRYAEYLVTRR